MAMQVNGIAIPATIENRADLYDWQPPLIVGRNGRGRVIEVGYASLAIGWTWIFDSDWEYWVTTILAGERDALLTGVTLLYDDNKVLRTITSCIVHKPTHLTIINGIHSNVRLFIDQIVTA